MDVACVLKHVQLEVLMHLEGSDAWNFGMCISRELRLPVNRIMPPSLKSMRTYYYFRKVVSRDFFHHTFITPLHVVTLHFIDSSCFIYRMCERYKANKDNKRHAKMGRLLVTNDYDSFCESIGWVLGKIQEAGQECILKPIIISC